MTKNGLYSQTREEMEVHICFSAVGSGAVVHSTYPAYNRKLDALCAKHPEAYRRIPDPNGIEDDWRRYEIADRNLVSLRAPVSQARREAARRSAAALSARREI